MLKIALTGGLACGKSTVAEQLMARGVAVVDADQGGRVVLEPGSEGLAEVVAVFGAAVLDEQGRLDRPLLRRRVFADPLLRQRLEAITHPRIRAWMAEQVCQLAKQHRFVVEMIPLLLETQQAARFDWVIVVDLPLELQRQRAQARDGVSAEQVERIIQSQVDRQQRLAAADFVIDNAGDLRQLAPQVDRLMLALTALEQSRA